MLEVYDEAIRLAPIDSTLHGLGGWDRRRWGDSATHSRTSPGLARSTSTTLPATTSRGFLYLDTLGDPVETVKWLSRSAAIDPQDPELAAWTAIAYLTLDELSLAARDATRALEMSETNGGVVSIAALAYLFQGNEEAAHRLARRGLEPGVVDRFGGRVVSLRVLRTHWLRTGQVDEALRAYEASYPTVARGERFRTRRWLIRRPGASASTCAPPSISHTSARWPATRRVRGRSRHT